MISDITYSFSHNYSLSTYPTVVDVSTSEETRKSMRRFSQSSEEDGEGGKIKFKKTVKRMRKQ